MNDLTEIEDQLRDAAHAYAGGVEPAPDAWERLGRRSRAASHRRRGYGSVACRCWLRPPSSPACFWSPTTTRPTGSRHVRPGRERRLHGRGELPPGSRT